MKENSKSISVVLIIIIITSFLLLGCTAARHREISKREIWRTMEYDRIRNLTIANNLLLFEAVKKDESIDCHCVYAVDKTTGKLIWSTEQLAQPHIREKETDTEWIWNRNGIVDIVALSLQHKIVYIAINFETLYALNIVDGRPIWNIDNIEGLNLFDSNFSDSQFFVMDKQGNLLVLDKLSGNKLWERSIYQDVENESAHVSFCKGIVLVGVDFVDSDNLLAFNPRTGQKIWETDIAKYFYPRLYSTDMFIANTGTVNLEGHYLAGFDIATGNKVWEQYFDEPYLEFAFSSPSTDENQFYVLISKGDENHQRIAKLLVLDIQGGKSLWEFNGDFSHRDISYFVDNEIVYIGTEDGYVFAIDDHTGQVLWETFTSGFPSHFFLNEGILIVAMEEDAIVGLDAKTGQEKWKSIHDTKTIFPQGSNYTGSENNIRIYNDVLYLVSEKPDIYAISSANGKKLWSWNHNSIIPFDRGYSMRSIDGSMIYVVGGSRWFGSIDYGLFALKSEP